MKKIISIDDTIDLETLYTSFISEVEEVVSSDQFLAGNKNPEPLYFKGSRKTLRCKICELNEFSAECDTDLGDYTSKFNGLKERILDISQPLVMVESCIDTSETRFVGSKIEGICKVIETNDNFKRIVNNVFKQTPPNFDAIFAFNFTHSTICTHFAGIVHARTLTLSKRYLILEAVLEAYRIGLFPFGWDKREKELLCVNPIDL